MLICSSKTYVQVKQGRNILFLAEEFEVRNKFFSQSCTNIWEILIKYSTPLGKFNGLSLSDA